MLPREPLTNHFARGFAIKLRSQPINQSKQMSNKNDTFFVKSNKLPGSSGNNQDCNNDLDLIISDIPDDDLEDEVSREQIRPFGSILVTKSAFSHLLNASSHPIDYQTAKILKQYLIGSSTGTIGQEWQIQYFEFENRVPELWYGLVQQKGGPCGVLAAVQAYLLAEYFHINHIDLKIKNDNLSNYQNKCLARAIGSILWQIGGNRQTVVVAIESHQKYLDQTSDFSLDGITERLQLCEFHSDAELNHFLMEMFTDNTRYLGCISLVYSCILSRGLDQLGQDYDSGSINSLITGETQLCTQELVNLILVGRAVSNVFDRTFNCNDLILQGITRQSTIGFLTLHEHNGDSKVGSCYKNPKLPIFVILSESHFTVIFSKVTAIETKFDLFYYDGLLGQDSEIRLTIELASSNYRSAKHKSVPLECVIRTKWPNAKIDWNDSPKLF